MALLHIGARRKAIKAARDVVMEVLRAKDEPAVKIAAFNALASICETHATVKGCTFNGAETKAMDK
jgi:hypothetical protein